MRFQELVLRIPGDELRVRFHQELTVLSGLGDEERTALAESLVAAIAGSGEGTVLRYVDNGGRPVEVVSEGGRARARYLDDETTALPLIGTMVAGEDELRSMMLLRPGDLGLEAATADDTDDPELVEARKTLAELTEELEAALGSREREERLRAELEEIETSLRQVEDDAARREYAALLEQLERVRAEAAVIRGGGDGAQSDAGLIGSFAGLQDLLQAWSEAADAVRALTEGDDPERRLDADTVADVHDVPDHAPPELDSLIAQHGQARANQLNVEAELRELTASTIARPSRTEVLDLAAAPQQQLWEAAERLQTSGQTLAAEELALGGAGDQGSVAEGVAERIEAAQRAIDAAEAQIDRRWTSTIALAGIVAASSLLLATVNIVYGPLMLVLAGAIAGVRIGLPAKALREAQAVEMEALMAADASSYLGFHLRRVQAVTAPGARHSVEAAAMEQRHAAQAWHEIVGDIDVDTAIALRNEVIVFAARLATSDGVASEIDDLRRRLADDVEPVAARCRAELVAAVAPFHIDGSAVDDEALLRRLVQQQAALGRRARAQLVIERAEADERHIAANLDGSLRALGFDDGTLPARVTALEWAVERAREREGARTHARPAQEIDSDLERIESEIRRLRRPEWASVEAADACPPDTAALERRRTEVRQKLEAPGRPHGDAVRLADRCSAMERRVAALESQHNGDTEEVTIGQLADLNGYLLAHLGRAGHLGPFEESLPVVVDDAFVRVAAERKWELLDMLRRLAEQNQLVYLTDDPFVAAWARRRASAGLITLLEPLETV